jgi:ATP-dependent Clp protease, protease subunit
LLLKKHPNFVPNKKDKMPKATFKITAELGANKTAQLTIVGHISSWENSSADFTQSVNTLVEQGVKKAKLYMNTGGGDCFQANEIVNVMAVFSRVDATLGALCASAGTYIASKCTTVKASKNTQYMIHKPMTMLIGNSDEVKADLKLLENLEAMYMEVYMAKTGLSKKAIQEMWKTDYWMNATEAKEKGFVDTIADEEAVITEEDVNAVAEYDNAPQMVATTIPHTETNPEKTIEMKKTLVSILAIASLTEASTDTQFTAEITALKAKADKADALKTELDALKVEANKVKHNAVLDKAVGDKKIVAGQREFYAKALATDFDGTKAHLEAMPSASKLTDHIEAGAGAGEDRSKWTYAEFQEKAPKDLQAMATTDEPRFKKLFKAEYGVDC